MKSKTVITLVSAVIIFLILLTSFYFIGSGFSKINTVALSDYFVSEDGTLITLHITLTSSVGHTRGFKDIGGGAKPHYLTFYSTFGGINSEWRARSEYTLPVDENDTEIYFNRGHNGYELVLQKDKETGEWVRP